MKRYKYEIIKKDYRIFAKADIQNITAITQYE